mmetsp:Transcript_87663/g.246246  ORF Transcript_87663/g.246246 Transcript_87663/m.246246 type:complete len:201 (+) Transcript_87663:170-772(+)
MKQPFSWAAEFPYSPLAAHNWLLRDNLDGRMFCDTSAGVAFVFTDALLIVCLAGAPHGQAFVIVDSRAIRKCRGTLHVIEGRHHVPQKHVPELHGDNQKHNEDDQESTDALANVNVGFARLHSFSCGYLRRARPISHNWPHLRLRRASNIIAEHEFASGLLTQRSGNIDRIWTISLQGGVALVGRCKFRHAMHALSHDEP